MPELPEVETIKSELNKLIKDKKIKSVVLKLAKQVKGDQKKFLQFTNGAKIKSVSRRAKTIIFELNNKYFLVFHLKLTGQLIYQRKSALYPSKYSHVIFNFTDGSKLFFNDLRQFGWVKLVDKNELDKMDAEYGPEPLDKSFSFEKFKILIKNKKSVIKPLLLDQKFLAGVGNIYAQEALFCAGIKPIRRANALKENEIKKLYNCLQKILKLAIEKKGTSAADYVDAFGQEGNMPKFLKVYGRAGEKCRKCRAVLKLIKQGARSTVYCGKCQR